MDQETFIMELEERFDRISCGLNAMELMVFGLEGVQNPYTDGFYAVWTYLRDAEEEVKRLVQSVSTARAIA